MRASADMFGSGRFWKVHKGCNAGQKSTSSAAFHCAMISLYFLSKNLGSPWVQMILIFWAALFWHYFDTQMHSPGLEGALGNLLF